MNEATSDRADSPAFTTQQRDLIDAWWRAANYLSVGQIYLLDNPLLEEPLTLEHIKPRLLGHWGTTPGLNFIYAHLNHIINQRDLNMIFIAGPGHGGPAMIANTYLEGTYYEHYHDVSLDRVGMGRLFKQFSFPGGVPSHVSPEVPGSIHEGGELGYALSHAFGAAFDNPDLIVACVIGDGEAETGPLAASWHSNKFLNPWRDGVVLPILHLNGYKIANPTILARIPHAELRSLLEGYGWKPYFVEDSSEVDIHEFMAAALDSAINDILAIKSSCSDAKSFHRPKWPMIVLKTPKGWTGPEVVDGKQVANYWRSHQVPLFGLRENPEHLKLLQEWMLSYRPRELFDDNGAPKTSVTALAPKGHRRMGANPHANGGLLRKDLDIPDFRRYAVTVPEPGTTFSEATSIMGKFLRDVMASNTSSFRVFGPDETASNRLDAIYEVTSKTWMAEMFPVDSDGGNLSPDGRVMEILSEHTCLGWLEGYVLTGRHGLFNTYEAFSHIITSMFNQHAKWLKVATHEIPWRASIPSVNILLSSHVWRQDHNGFSHQDPGFIDNVVNKKGDVIRVYLPPDANSLLVITDRCLRSRDHINVIVAGKQAGLQYMTMSEAIKHCSKGIGIWQWASNDFGQNPDVVMACCGDVPSLETLGAVALLREWAPELKIRVVNVVDLMTLTPPEEHPHGLTDKEFDALFTASAPIIFAFHGYPWLIHRLTYRRTNHKNLHVRGYKEEGTTTTPFDMAVRNDIDRYHLFGDVIDRVPTLAPIAGYAGQFIRDALVEHREYINKYGEDLPIIQKWLWPYPAPE